MRFLGLALLLLSAAVLANAAVGHWEDDDDLSGTRYRLFKRNSDRSAEGRNLAHLLSAVGANSNNNGNCAPAFDTTTEIIPSPVTVSGESTITDTPTVPTSGRGYDVNENDDDDGDDVQAENDDDDENANDDDDIDDVDVANVNGLSLFRRGSSRPGQVLTLQEYEMRRQAEENKELRKRIESLRRQNIQNIRRAQRARKRLRRRSKNQRRRSNLRNRNARRRLNNRHRNIRRRLRRNRRRN